jgi:hypothetical protein
LQLVEHLLKKKNVKKEESVEQQVEDKDLQQLELLHYQE